MIEADIVFVFPKPDKAAQTIWSELKQYSYFNPTDLTFDGNVVWKLESDNHIYAIHSKRDGVFADHLENGIKTKLFIFISRHSAASGRPAILVHATGNWAKKTLGGNNYELSHTSATALRCALANLHEMRNFYQLDNYSVNIEVTHHGPTTLSTPLIFIELGSTEEQWMERKPAKTVGEAAIKTAKTLLTSAKTYKHIYIGAGGNHYAYRFHKFLLENSDVATSHIAPKHVLDTINSFIVNQAIEKTQENVEAILIDKKGTKSEQRKKIIEIAEKLNKEAILI